MRLGPPDGDFLELSVVGYQFPDAEDPRQRFSWHMVEGSARTGAEQWDFRWQALTCDESGRLVSWLRAAADASAGGVAEQASGPGRAWFTEPNIALEVESYAGDQAVIRVELDLEFRAPSNKPDYRAGNPTVLGIRATAEQLSHAADALEADVKRYPDEPGAS